MKQMSDNMLSLTVGAVCAPVQILFNNIGLSLAVGFLIILLVVGGMPKLPKMFNFNTPIPMNAN